MADGDGQTALDEYAGEDGDDHGEDDLDLDRLREDVDSLTAMMNTLVESHEELAGAVEDVLTDDARDELAAAIDAAEAGEDHVDDLRGIQ